MATHNGEAQIIRIVKKKGGHGGHHGGAWKVAYADFVTAMLALFIVLWIMAQSQSIRQNVSQYFKNPGLLPHSQGLMEKSDMGGEMPTPGHSQELQRPSPAPADVVDDQKRLEETKKKIEEIIAQMPELESLKDLLRFQITDEGLRIELMEREDGRFFEVGSAKINPQAHQIFGIIAKELSELPNRLTIEGHTDSRPYGKQDYSNWELSADRANSARRLMDNLGAKPGQIGEVRGYADRHLLNAQDPNDYKNRRVSIIVKFLDKDKEKPLNVELSPSKDKGKTGAEPPKAGPAPVPPAKPAPVPAAKPLPTPAAKPLPPPAAVAVPAAPPLKIPLPTKAQEPSSPPAAPALKAPPVTKPTEAVSAPALPALKPFPGINPPEPSIAPAGPALPAPPVTRLPEPVKAPALPALKPPLPPGKGKVEAGPAPGPGADKHKTGAAKTPPVPENPKPVKGPLEDNLDLQKQLLNLAPQPPPVSLK